MQKIEAYAQSNLTAAGAVSQLTTDQQVFSNDTLTATARISDLDNAYTTLAGNFVSQEQAQLTVTGVRNLAGTPAAGTSMRGPMRRRSDSRVVLLPGLRDRAGRQRDGPERRFHSAGHDLHQRPDREAVRLHGRQQNASAAVQDLKKWEDSLTGSLQAQGLYLSTTLSNDLDSAILKYSGVQTAVNNYAQALVDFGPKSTQAQNAQTLMNDAIVKGGIAAGQTNTAIAQMIAEQDKIPLKEAIQIVLNAEGQYSIRWHPLRRTRTGHCLARRHAAG